MSDVFEKYREESTPDETVVRVCFDRVLYRQLQDAVEAFVSLGEPTTLDDDGRRELADRVVRLEEKVREAERPLTFRCLPFEEWKALAEAHPPTDEQKNDNRRAELNEETFWPAAVSECCVDPGMSVEQAEWLRSFLPREKWGELVAAVHKVNVGGSEVPKYVSVTVARLKQGLSSISPAEPEFPSPSSEEQSEGQTTLDG